MAWFGFVRRLAGTQLLLDKLSQQSQKVGSSGIF
jgi:hypothetical protein